MSPDSIARLSRKLLRSSLADEGSVVLHSSDWREKLADLESPAREQLAQFVQSVRDGIPTDFSFTLVFSYGGVEVPITFEDGNTSSDVGAAFFSSFKSLRRAMKRTDWDGMRTEAIEGSKVFDELLSDAEDRPVNIPSSAAAAKVHADELASAIAEVRARNPLPAFALVITREDAGLAIETMSSRAEVVFIIADRMTTQCDILAVLERGVCWSWDELEAAKREAVEELGPISRAKAERRFAV